MGTFENVSALIQTQQQELHIHQYGFTTTDKVKFSQGVRQLCEMNSCGHFGKTWACPPGVGELETCMEKIRSYKNMFVFTTLHQLEDSYDFEGMMDGKDKHDEYSDVINEKLKEICGNDCLILSGESCNRCSKCTYPDEPCRFPELLAPSVESYGVEVNRLAATVNVNYINGANTVTYFGCICFN